MKKMALLGLVLMLAGCGGDKDTTSPPPALSEIRTYAVTDDALYNVILYGAGNDEYVMKLSYSSSITDVAKANNSLYASTFGSLLRIDAAAKTVDVVGSYGVSDINALTVDGSGQLYGASLSGKLYRINTTDGQATEVANIGYQSSGDLAVQGNTFYFTVKAGESTDSLAKMKLNDAKATLIGQIGYDDVYGLDSGNNVLYGRTNAGEIIQIDPVTAKATLLRKTGLSFASL